VSHIINNDIVMFAAVHSNRNEDRASLAWKAHELAGRVPDAFKYDKSVWLTLLDRLVMLGYVREVETCYEPTTKGIETFKKCAEANQKQASRIYNIIAFGV
jgi:hypothetical protein